MPPQTDQEPNLTDVSIHRKVRSAYKSTTHRPALAGIVIILSFITAFLEGVGVGFILPIIESARSTGGGSEQGGTLLKIFKQTYEFLGVPFELEFIIIGVSLVMIARYSLSFIVDLLKITIRTEYVRDLQRRGFNKTLSASVKYFDTRGSDEVLNAIVTQSKEAGKVIKQVIEIVEEILISLVYIGISLYLAPVLTVVSAIMLGFIIFMLRSVLESGFTIGDRVVDANKRIQSAAQAGTQGIRDVKLFNLSAELKQNFRGALAQFTRSTIAAQRNKSAMNNAYQLIMSITLFGLIFLALSFTNLSIGELGIFLFANFRLAPRISSLNNKFYGLAAKLPHQIQTEKFISELNSHSEPTTGKKTIPDEINTFKFEDVSFSYEKGELVLNGISFTFEKGDFVAFVGQSGAGKSTIASLLGRLYKPDKGSILANSINIEEFDVQEWRERVAFVRQNPFIFDESLRYNLTVGNRDASQTQIERICEISQVTEFLNELPNGYDTQLGDDGVRLSGGQRQRVAIARALLKDDIDLLVLDEATSDLDSELEQLVHDAIEEMDRNYAMLVIAHRLSTVKNADRIYALVDGQIAESGTHEELYSKAGVYSELYSTQTTAPQ